MRIIIRFAHIGNLWDAFHGTARRTSTPAIAPNTRVGARAMVTNGRHMAGVLRPRPRSREILCRQEEQVK